MKRRIWERIVSVGCAISLFMIATGMTVIADEVKEDDSVIMVQDEDGQEKEEEQEYTESLTEVEDDKPESDLRDGAEETEGDDEVTFFVEEDSSFNVTEELVGSGDDYPSNLKNAAKDALVDPWNFYNRECTSFVAWCLNSRNGVHFTNQYMGASRWGNAIYWGTVASSLGIRVDNTPAVGSVAWWNTGKYGHVAWVSEVYDNSILIEEYNHGISGGYGTRTISKSNPAGYIHIADLAPSEPVTWADVSIDKNIAQVGENITFSFSSDHGIGYTIGIDDDNGRMDTYDTHATSYTSVVSQSFL